MDISYRKWDCHFIPATSQLWGYREAASFPLVSIFSLKQAEAGFGDLCGPSQLDYHMRFPDGSWRWWSSLLCVIALCEIIMHAVFLFLGTAARKWPNKCRIYIFLSRKNTALRHLPMLPSACTGTSQRSWRAATHPLTRPILKPERIGWVSERHPW